MRVKAEKRQQILHCDWPDGGHICYAECTPKVRPSLTFCVDAPKFSIEIGLLYGFGLCFF